jgi:hypothetical protein
MRAWLGAWFRRVVLSRRWLTFIVLGLAFFVFGSGSLNLFFLLKANADLLALHGWQAVMDGALQQTVELVVTGYVSIAALCRVQGMRTCARARPGRQAGSSSCPEI